MARTNDTDDLFTYTGSASGSRSKPDNKHRADVQKPHVKNRPRPQGRHAKPAIKREAAK